MLRKIGRYDRSIIVFLSDHGEMMGDHYLWRKTYAYEGSMHVPLMIYLPYGEQCGRQSVLATHTNLMPTLLNAVGAPPDFTTDGIDLFAQDREFLHGEHVKCFSGWQDMQYLTGGRYKYIWLPRVRQEQFFDLQKDPGERHYRIKDRTAQPEV